MTPTQIKIPIHQEIVLDRTMYDDANEDTSKFSAPEGLTEETVREISSQKKEPEWMLAKRLQGLKLFMETALPDWGPNLSGLDLNKIIYFVRPDAPQSTSWDKVPADIKRTFERIGIPEAERKSLSGVGAQYDCLVEDSLVYTNPRGAIKIRDVRVGDTIFAYDEESNRIVKTTVKAVLNKGRRPVFDLVVAGRKLQATYNHPFLALVDKRKEGAKRARYIKEWKYLNQLKPGDLIAIATDLPDCGVSYPFPKLSIKTNVIGRNQTTKSYNLDISGRYNHIRLPTSTNEDLMWFLGLLIGDGYIKREKDKDKCRVFFAIPTFQEQLRREFIHVCKTLFDYQIKSSSKYWLSINSTILARFLEKIGFSGNAKTKSIPSWVFTLPKNELLSFLGGYLDSDGNVRDSTKSKDVVYTSVNVDLLEKVKQICTYCGIQTSKITTFSSKHPYDSQRRIVGHRLHLSGKTHIIKSRYDFKRKRLFLKNYFGKFNSARGTTIRKYCSDSVGFARVESIRYSGKKPVYDLSVHKYRNFVAHGIIVHNSDVVYHKLKKEWEDQGVVFLNMDDAVSEHPEIVKKYFMTQCVPVNDHKFIMLHAAVWSGGTFIYVPPGVKVTMPLQAYFRMNAKRGGQFEHTLIIADKGSEVHYIEGCSAPVYNESSLHAGCVELFVHEGAKISYSSVENWSRNTYNLNTKRALVDKDGTVEFINGNMGSGVTMLYPCAVLRGEGAKSDFLGVAFAGPGQNQDTGSKVIHAAPRTSSTIRSKSISRGGGISSYRGFVKVTPRAAHSKVSVDCDALLVDDQSVSNTYPSMKIENKQVDIAHEARVGKISEEDIYYLMSRGISEQRALQMVVAGFIEPVVRKLPLEYAVELNKLIELEMENSVG